MTEKRYMIEVGDPPHRRVVRAPDHYPGDYLTRLEAALRIAGEMAGLISEAKRSSAMRSGSSAPNRRSAGRPQMSEFLPIKRHGIVFVGMETSGALRRRFQAMGFETYSCDVLPCEDDGGEEMAYSADGLPLGRHIVGDVFHALDNMQANDLWPVAGIFHPDCTYLTGCAAWAFKDGPYHQKVKPGTLVGAARRDAREGALADVRRIMALKMKVKLIENPVGAIGSRIRPATQSVHPHHYGDDASKRTCLWILDEDGNDLPPIPRRPDLEVPGRPVMRNGKPTFYWSNQTDTGQNRLSPSDTRWKDRSRTYPGIADAIAAHVEQMICRLPGYGKPLA